MTHDLFVWVDEHLAAQLIHDPADDHWALSYTPTWRAHPAGFPLAPLLPWELAPTGSASSRIKRFIEHLLPEGRALDVALHYNGLSRSNVFGLIRALGAETAGALRFSADAAPLPADGPTALREIPLAELADRITLPARLPLNVWDGRVRMSVAGLQDKLLVYIPPAEASPTRLFLVEGPQLASTHLLKPDLAEPRTPHLAINEHFCLQLAQRMGLPAAEATLLRAPRPVLVVRRFDREVVQTNGQTRVQRRHVIDACQALDVPLSFKYERNLGSAAAVAHIRDGVSFERLFSCAQWAENPALTRLVLLRWALFQFLIGNSDAHGKNFSFFVRPGGWLAPAPWYDLVSVRQYLGFDQELAMAYGDTFQHEAVSAFDWADFASRCGIDRHVLRREGQRLAKLAPKAAQAQAASAVYQPDEQTFLQNVVAFVTQQAQRLAELVAGAASIRAEYL